MNINNRRNEDPQFDIGIPFVGGVDLLKDTIKSVIDQDYENWRLTVVDNSQNFDSQFLRQKFIDEPRINFVHLTEEFSMSGNWNNCLTQSAGNLAIICHSDDLWSSNVLSEMVALISEEPNAAGYFVSAFTIDEFGEPKKSIVDEYKHFLTRKNKQHFILNGRNGIHQLSKGNFIFCSGICFRKTGNSFPIFEENWKFVPDYKMSINMLLEGGSLHGSRKRLVKYRRHPGQATVALEKSFLRFEEEMAFYDWLGNIAQENLWTEISKVCNRRLSLRIHVGLFAIKALFRAKWSTFVHYTKLSLSKPTN